MAVRGLILISKPVMLSLIGWSVKGKGKNVKTQGLYRYHPVMNLPDEAIQEYKELIQEDFGYHMTDDEARESAESFMRLVRLLITPPTSNRETRRVMVQCRCGN